MKQLKVKPQRRSSVHTKPFVMDNDALADILMLPKNVKIVNVRQQHQNENVVEFTLVSTKEIPNGKLQYIASRKKRGGLFKWVWEKK